MTEGIQPTLVFEDKDWERLKEGELVKIFKRHSTRGAYLINMCLETKTDEGDISFVQQRDEEVVSYQTKISHLKYNGNTHDELNGSIIIHFRKYQPQTYKSDSPEHQRGKDMLIKVGQWEDII